MGWSTQAWPFFPGWIAFQNFLLADLKLGEKSWRRKKKSGSKSEQKGPDLRAPTTQPCPLTLIGPMTDVFLSNRVNNNRFVCL
jgi:hypothetical protein